MFRPTIAEDVTSMAPIVREEDVREVRSITGLSIEEALTIGFFSSSDCVTGFGKTGEIALIAGVVPVIKGASVWMISTKAIIGNARLIVTEGNRWITEMVAKHGLLHNVVDARNTIHQRLIKHMGFTFQTPKINYGVGQIPVIPFIRTQTDV